jgi:hypothetical protein
MATYMLRDVPPEIWEPLQRRVHSDGWHLRRLILQLIEDYGAGRISPSTKPETTPPHGMAPLKCPKGHEFLQAFYKAILLTHPQVLDEIYCQQCGAKTDLNEGTRANLISWAHTKDESIGPTA